MGGGALERPDRERLSPLRWIHGIRSAAERGRRADQLPTNRPHRADQPELGDDPLWAHRDGRDRLRTSALDRNTQNRYRRKLNVIETDVASANATVLIASACVRTLPDRPVSFKTS